MVRPGLIVGPHDPTFRFTYWISRLEQAGDVLAPGDPQATTQLIDARDLARWMVRLLEAGTTGTFNATGPATPLTMADAISACALSSVRPNLVWAPEQLLLSTA